MIYEDRTDEGLLEIMEKAKAAKLDWLGTFSRGPKKRPDDNIMDQRIYAEVFDQICRKLRRSISLRAEPRSGTKSDHSPANQDENKGYRFGGQAR